MASIISDQGRAQYQKQDGKCCWCLQPMDPIPKFGRMLPPRSWSPTRATLEHIVPRYYNGAGGWRNIVLAHYRCNVERGVKLMTPHFCPPDAAMLLDALRLRINGHKNKKGEPVPPSRLYLTISPK